MLSRSQRRSGEFLGTLEIGWCVIHRFTLQGFVSPIKVVSTTELRKQSCLKLTKGQLASTQFYRNEGIVMLIQKAVPSIARCSKCRVALLNAVAPYVALSARPAARVPHARYRTRDDTIQKCFSTSPVWASDLVEQTRQKQLPPVDEMNIEPEQYTESKSEPTISAVPWYLQVETPQRASNPLLDRQRIPELPNDPPPLLKPILEHISIDLGLDDLTLFDLREIDPPPALGSNLIMVLGTARSEKHLHVSADRFCRWLKTTYKLSPYADGLMGRGEIKLKLRRKARRARLLSSVGSSETSTTDDGLRTGWICVNIGTIEDGRKSVKNATKQHGYVGFGSEADGAKVVIQMLTQEKREELDLEDLWGKMVRRHERKQNRISEAPDEVTADEKVDQSSISESFESNGPSAAISS